MVLSNAGLCSLEEVVNRELKAEASSAERYKFSTAEA